MGQARFGEQAPTRPQVVQQGKRGRTGLHELRQAGAEPRDLPERLKQIGLGLIELVNHRHT